MLDGWNGLQKYLEDGRYDIDNSLSERSIRPFSVGRSACKGFTSEEGARIAARFSLLWRHSSLTAFLQGTILSISSGPSPTATVTMNGSNRWRMPLKTKKISLAG